MSYLIVCNYCGTTLMKARDSVLAVLAIEIKCPNPNCKKLLRMPGDTHLIKEENPKQQGYPGLDG